jgi:hypothetical protein
MPLIEIIKEKVEKITGWGRPKRREVDAVLRPRKLLPGPTCGHGA